MLAWLLAPIDPQRLHDVGFYVAWHARLMALARAFWAPVGVLVARFFKITLGQDWPAELDNRFWWHTHCGLQYAAGAAMAAALAFILMVAPMAVIDGFHELFGWGALLLAINQFVSGWLRGSKGGPTDPARDGSIRGDHYDMTARRRIFEYSHKRLGYCGIFFASGAIVTGLWQVNAPRWMWMALGAWRAVLALMFAAFQRRGMAVDTYRAIWGHDYGSDKKAG